MDNLLKNLFGDCIGWGSITQISLNERLKYFWYESPSGVYIGFGGKDSIIFILDELIITRPMDDIEMEGFLRALADVRSLPLFMGYGWTDILLDRIFRKNSELAPSLT